MKRINLNEQISTGGVSIVYDVRARSQHIDRRILNSYAIVSLMAADLVRGRTFEISDFNLKIVFYDRAELWEGRLSQFLHLSHFIRKMLLSYFNQSDMILFSLIFY